MEIMADDADQADLLIGYMPDAAFDGLGWSDAVVSGSEIIIEDVEEL